ncbi:MAG: hypothetical protein GEU75_01380 [Dehalococcoidia bacterium]|nr:hypothetical protein [Dehalococcoidia bacterium]
MYDRYPDRLPEPPPPRRRSPWSRIISSFLLNSARLLGGGLFLLTGLALVIPLVVFLIRSIDPDRPERIPYAERVGHAHGLAVDPADGALYVTTTRGMFWIKSPEWAQRSGGDSYQDSRALIAVRPGEFLASGQPDIRDRVSGFAPQYSGLIRSQDAGTKWRSVSLSGKANFHALEAKHGAVFGYETLSGGFMVSSDAGKTWETRSQPAAPLLDFAVNPADAGHIYAVTEEAVLISRDGGRSWQPGPGEPLRFLVWLDPSHLWGADVDGGIYLSADSGANWQQQGSLTAPLEAFLALDNALYAATYDEDAGIVIHASLDSGKTWEERYRDPLLHEPSEPGVDATP